MKNHIFKPKFIALFITANISPTLFAGHVYSGIDYQYFRDFAENKGQFAVGAQNIEIVNKKGESLGNMLQDVPMIDFSPVSRNGVAALVGDQYIVSVAHNVGYQNVDFGAEGNNPDQHRYSYRIVKRNNYKNDNTHPYMTDYHNPRLAKFVTEAAPIGMVSNMQGSTYADLEKYPMRVRIGSGWQFLRNDNDEGNHISMAYQYRTAGNTFMQGWANNGEVSLSGDVRYPNQYGPLPISGSSGDSGSPMFIYDKSAEKWLLNGVLRSGHPYQGKENTYQIARKSYLDEVFDGDQNPGFYSPTSASYTWQNTKDGFGSITQAGQRRATEVALANPSLADSAKDDVPTYQGPNPYSPRLHHGKNIWFGNGDKGEITIIGNINQGAGGLTFEGDFIVQPQGEASWQGAGISISEGSTVTWRVKNPQGDRLSKIGLGMLLVNGKGENLGDISVGDGLVVLDQQADEQGKKQAFNQVGIVSGRPTVKLAGDNQVDPNKIYFGFRGGRLDLNGHSLTFNRIQNTDEGAQIVNHHADTAATVTVLGNSQINNENNINQSKAVAFNGWFGETDETLHNGRLNVVYQPTHNESIFLLSGGTNLNGEISQTNGTLVFSGRPTPHAYNHQNRPALIGRPQGEVVIDDDWLNRTFKAEKFIIDGGSAVVSRNVSAINGDWQLSNDASASLGVTDSLPHLICARSDWTGLTKCNTQTLSEQVFASLARTQINGNVKAAGSAAFSVQGLANLNGNVTLTADSQYRLTHGAGHTGALTLNDNAQATVDNATLTGNITAGDQTKYQLVNNAVQHGNITLNDNAQATVNAANLAGDVTLAGQAALSLINTTFSHKINATEKTNVALSQAHWILSDNATIGHLTLNNGQITLNTETADQGKPATFHRLTLLGDLNGNGEINYRTYLENYLGDHVVVNGVAKGDFVLKVNNSGQEPQTLQQLSLLTLKNAAQAAGLANVSLANGTVDAGTYRYELKNFANDYRLYNPKKEQELVEQARLAEEQRKAAEAARLAEEKRQAEEQARLEQERHEAAKAAEEAARIAEAKRQAEELARLERERREAEEAARLAQEKQKAEELARLAEEKRQAAEQARLAQEKRDAEQAARLEKEKRDAEEKAKLAEAKRQLEEKIRAEQLAEQQRRDEEAARLAAQRNALAQESAAKKQKDLISRYANSALSEFSAGVNGALLAQDELAKHLASDSQVNVWANTLYSSRRYDADEFRPYRQKTRLAQLGAQHVADHYRLGVLFSHARTNSDFADNISSKGRLNMLSAFAKYDFANGLNLSADVGYGLSVGEIRGESDNANIKRRIATFGVGLGYRLSLAQLSIKPNVGVHRYYVSAENYTYANVEVHSPSAHFNAYYAGITVDYAFAPWAGVTMRPSFSLNYVDAADSKVAVRINQSQLTQRFDRYWQQEIGLTADVANWQIATYAGQSRGKQLAKQHQIGLKVGYHW